MTLASDIAEPTTRMGTWYANRLWLPPKHHVIFVNEQTLLPVIVRAAPAKTVVPRFVHQLGLVLRALGVDETSIAVETASMDTAIWGKTSNRSVVGSMGDFIFLAEHRQDHPSLLDLSLQLADTPCRAGRPKAIWPYEQTRQLFDEHP